MSGFRDFTVGLLSAVPFLVGSAAMVFVARSSDRTGERCGHVAVCSLVAGIGFLASAYTNSPWAALAALAIASIGLNGRQGPFWAIPTIFLSDDAAAGGIAMLNTLAATAGFVAPYAVGLVKDATGSFAGGLMLLAGASLGGSVLALRLRRAPVLATVGPRVPAAAAESA